MLGKFFYGNQIFFSMLNMLIMLLVFNLDLYFAALIALFCGLFDPFEVLNTLAQ